MPDLFFHHENTDDKLTSHEFINCKILKIVFRIEALNICINTVRVLIVVERKFISITRPFIIWIKSPIRMVVEKPLKFLLKNFRLYPLMQNL
jgi:hypothetical protein